MPEPQFAYIRGHFTNWNNTVDGWKFQIYEDKDKPMFVLKVQVPPELAITVLKAEPEREQTDV